MLTDLAQRELDGARHVHPRPLRWRARPPRPSPQPNGARQFLAEKVELGAKPLAPAQVMKLLRFS